MKSPLFTTALLICFFSIALCSEAGRGNKLKHDSLSCLQIEGKIKNMNDGSKEDCIVELIGLDGQIDSVVLKSSRKKFKFMLKKDSHYGIRISRKGYIGKLVSINTDIQFGDKSIHVFEFETSLLKDEEIKSLNKDILDFPVAIIHFNFEHECFSYNKEYSEYIKRELYAPVQKNRTHEETYPTLSTRFLASAGN